MKSKSDKKIECHLDRLMAGRNICYCCDDSGPDTSAMAAANEKSAAYAKEVADNDLAFRKQQYTDMQPTINKSMDLANQVAQGQLTDSVTSRDRATVSWNRWQDVGITQQDKMIADANAYGTEADQEQQGRRAGVAVKDALTRNQEAATRNMERNNVNPASGTFQGLQAQSAIQGAALEAGAENNARVSTRDKGISLRAGASAALAGQPNVAGQQMGLTTASGSSAVANSGAGVNVGSNWANFATGGVGNAISAANLSIQSNLGLAQLDAQASAGTGQLIGGLGMAAATMF